MGRNRMTVRIEGGEELLKAIGKINANLEDVLEVAVQAGAQVIAKAANPLAPAPRITTETVEKGKGRVTVDVGPPDEKWYWRFLEFGAQAHEITGSPLVFEGAQGLVVTGRVRHPGLVAKQFLRPAFDGKRGKAKDVVGDELREAVER